MRIRTPPPRPRKILSMPKITSLNSMPNVRGVNIPDSNAPNTII